MRKAGILASVALAAALGCRGGSEVTLMPLADAQGEIAGEVTDSSVILQSRLTLGSEPINGDLPGGVGVARFELSPSSDFSGGVVRTRWLAASPVHDFIVKIRIGGLAADTKYYYRLAYGRSTNQTSTGPVRSFTTLPGAGIAREVSFVAVTGMNYDRFQGDPRLGSGLQGEYPYGAYAGPDKALGFPALETIADMGPDFFVSTGDNVYYDQPYDGRATTAASMRERWHRQLVQPRFVALFSEVPAYFMKDDHDFRYNDSDTTGVWPPSPALASMIFREQVPVVDPDDEDAVTYRTFRVSRDLQIWLLEGRDYRSPNMMPPGSDKTLWGAEQRAWLERTLLGSDATFKILVSPGPMIGPDGALQVGRVYPPHDERKRDNHTNPDGFRYERDQFFAWLLGHDFLDKHLYIVNGDRHWQYHAVDPTGFEEFSTGALVDANAEMGFFPGDPESNDPEGRIEQPYHYDEVTGGFLYVTVSPGPPATAVFRFYDERGALLYETTKVASGGATAGM